MKAEGETKNFLQGLIQAAAGFHKLKQGETEGAAKLFTRAVKKLTKTTAQGTELRQFKRIVLKKIKLVPREGIEPTRP